MGSIPVIPEERNFTDWAFLLDARGWSHYNHPRPSLRMAKITLILSILFAVATALVGFLNQGKVQELKGTLETAQSQLTTTQTSLEQSNKTVEELEKNKNDLTSQTTQQASDITKLQSELAVEKTKVSELDEKVSEQETKLAEAATKAEAQTSEMDQLKGKLAEFEAAPKLGDEGAEKLKNLEEENTKLLGENSILKDRVNTLQQKENEAAAKTSLKRLSGRVLAVNQAWNFVVLDVGDKRGAMTNAELIVKRGSTAIGRVRITSVEPASSIADIIPASLVPGLMVQPGDQVIYADENM